MLNKNKIVVLLMLGTSFVPLAHASSFNEPYLGVEAIQTNQDYKLHHGKNVFKKNVQDYSVFGGFKFSHHFGAELGYEFQPQRKKTVSAGSSTAIPAKDDLFDELFNSSSITSTNRIKGQHPYLGLFGEYKHHFSNSHKMRFQAMLGASISKVKIKQHISSVTGTALADDVTGATLTGSKSKVVPMVKLSALYEFTEQFGVRLGVNYRNLSAIKIKIDQDTTHTQQVKLKDTFGLGLGLVYMFN